MKILKKFSSGIFFKLTYYFFNQFSLNINFYKTKILKKYQTNICIRKNTLKNKLRSCDNKKIVVGAGGILYSGWLSTDQDILNLTVEKDWKKLFKPESLDAILAEHVWEHLTSEQAIIASSFCFKYLKNNGYLRIAVPDGYHPNKNYIDWVKPRGIGPGSEDHKKLYTYKTISNLFLSVGFKVLLYEYYDENGVFHEIPWNPDDGIIRRSKKFDNRNADGIINYTSIILDARKP